MKVLGFIITIFFGHNSVWAQQSGEFLYQVGEKEGVMAINLYANSSGAENKSGNPIQIKTQIFRLNYEYGFFKNFSAYGGLTHWNSISEGEIEGLGPLQAGVKYMHALGPGNLFGRLNIDANILEGKFECSDSKCNASDGSVGANLLLAYQWALNNAFTGVALEYGLLSTDYKAEDGDSEDREGFFTLKLFYERAINDNMWGLVLSYINDGGLAGTKGTMPLVRNNFITFDETKTNAWALEGYLRSSISETMQLVTSLEYSRVLDDKVISSKSDNWGLDLTFRKLF